jgi:hypothetical protein
MLASLKSRRAVALAVACVLSQSALAAQSAEERSLTELRNTVVNLLQALVEKGVLSREQAQAMVQDAQKKAEVEAAALAAQDKAEEGAVRVPYVPEMVKQEIRKQVAADLAPEVAKEVVEQAKSEEWGVPAALPDWIKRVTWSGDVRVRGQGDLFDEANAQNVYVNFMASNAAGGRGKAGVAALLNTTEDRERLRARLRLALDAELGWGWSLGARLATGNFTDPVSTNQTLGNYGNRYQTGVDLAYLKWCGNSRTARHVLNVWGGRMPNPWLSTDLVWDPDLTFEGVATNYRFGLSRDDPYSRFVYATIGAFPLQEVELADDKWLFGAQVGMDWKFAGGSRLRMGVAYYDFERTAGKLNAPDSKLLDYTAPQYLQRGNTLFDIRNDTDTSTDLYALAADYRLADVTVAFDWRVAPQYRIGVTADYVQNVGYDEQHVLARTGTLVPARDSGYQAELSFGSSTMARNGAWRAFFGYRYLQRDAVLDAFTDSDFHLGGTDAKGYFIGGDYAFTQRVFARLRYLSANEIDGPPLGIDVLQFDINTQF